LEINSIECFFTICNLQCSYNLKEFKELHIRRGKFKII